MCKTGTGQQVAELHVSYMTMMMVVVMTTTKIFSLTNILYIAV